jgi:hypothetical protein
MSDKNKVLTPLSSAPNFDAMQVMPLNTDRAHPVVLAGGAAVPHRFADDTEMAFIYVPLASDGVSRIFVDVTRGDDPEKSFPLASGYWPFGTVGDPRTASFRLATGSATIIVMEA